MKSVGEKIRECREALGMSQPELAEKAGITTRTISKYETGAVKPRGSNLKKIANCLDVSILYLTTPEIEDVNYGRAEAPYLAAVQEVYGTKAASDIDKLLAENRALLAGGTIPQEEKDTFFLSIAKAYFEAKEEASRRYNPHKGDKK